MQWMQKEESERGIINESLLLGGGRTGRDFRSDVYRALRLDVRRLVMTAEEFLQRIYDLESDIVCKEDEIRKIHEDMINLKSVDIGQDRVDGGHPLDIADKVANLMEVEAWLNTEWDELIKWREKARSLITQLESGVPKSVLLLRVVNHRSWKQIAAIVHKSEDYCRHLYPLAVRDFGYLLATRFPDFLDSVDFKEYKAK